jgi:hypothetical protein
LTLVLFCCCICCIFDVAGGCWQGAHQWGTSQGQAPQPWEDCPHIPPPIRPLVMEWELLVPYQSGHEVFFQILSWLLRIYWQEENNIKWN